jgi:ferredoxin
VRVALETPQGRYTIDCGKEDFVWNAAARAGILLPVLCHQGQCLTCAARLVRGEVDQSAASVYFDADRQAGFVLLCSARPKSDLVLETDRQEAMRAHRKAHGLPAPYG